MTAQEGFNSLSFYCCSPFGQSMAVLPKPLPTFTLFWVPLWATCHRASVRPGASQAEFLSRRSQDQVRAALLAASHRLPFAESSSPQRSPWTGRSYLQHSVLCFWHESLILLPLPTFPYSSLENYFLPCQGLQPSFPQEMSFSVSPQNSRRKGTDLSFTIGHIMVGEAEGAGVSVLWSWHTCIFQ